MYISYIYILITTFKKYNIIISTTEVRLLSYQYYYYDKINIMNVGTYVQLMSTPVYVLHVTKTCII